MFWHTKSIRNLMLEYYKLETDDSSPNYAFVNKFKHLWEIIDRTEVEKFIAKDKIYDLYPLRNLLEDSENNNNRFNMEEMADAGEAFGELLEFIRKDLAVTDQDEGLKEIVRIPIEKHFT